MCTGHTHALSGAVTGAATGLYVLHLPLTGTVALAGLTAGAAVLPDIDHPDATLAHCFGFLTKMFAWLVGKIAGGHRKGTHSVLGIAVFTGLAWLAVAYRADTAGRIGLCVLLSLIIAGGLYALRIGGHWADLLAIGGAIAMTVTGTGLALVAFATGLGCATHVFGGDMLTDSGCPLAYPFSRYRFKWWGEPLAFTTGTRPEALYALVLSLGLGWLAYHAVTLPGALT
jgi:membrane-bound metal-dependent hydrolase YbcI (DUF457 family)